MNIAYLDEAQGLDLETARKWLEAHGWKRDNPSAAVTGWKKDKEWICDRSRADLLEEIPCIAKVQGCSVQAMLREMNPRWMSWPSDAAIAAHDGKWLTQRKDDGACAVGFMELRGGEFCLVFEIGRSFIRKQDGEHWHVWPCDRNGARVRRPTDEHGVMP